MKKLVFYPSSTSNVLFSSFHDGKIHKYPTAGKPSSVWIDFKNGEFRIGQIANGRINRRGCIIALNVPGIAPDKEYLMRQRFAGQDYRVAAQHIVAWYNNYVE